jgi:hypothetical protein
MPYQRAQDCACVIGTLPEPLARGFLGWDLSFSVRFVQLGSRRADAARAAPVGGVTRPVL